MRLPASTIANRSRRAFTLLELLVTIALMGIAGVMVIPAMGDSNVLRAQAAVRQIVSDIAFAQSDAVAYQQSRALVFDVPNSTYTIVTVPGSTIDLVNNTLYDPSRPGGKYVTNFATDTRFGDSRLVAASFDGGSTSLVFDGMGGVITGPGSETPGAGGTIRVNGSRQSFVISVEAFTGRTTVARDTTYVPPN